MNFREHDIGYLNVWLIRKHLINFRTSIYLMIFFLLKFSTHTSSYSQNRNVRILLTAKHVCNHNFVRLLDEIYRFPHKFIDFSENLSQIHCKIWTIHRLFWENRMNTAENIEKSRMFDPNFCCRRCFFFAWICKCQNFLQLTSKKRAKTMEMQSEGASNGLTTSS